MNQIEVSCRHLDICNPAIDDATVSDHVIEACPAETYTSIYVRTMDHHYPNAPGGVMEHSRLVQFQPTSLEAARHILSIIFQKTPVETLNLNRVAQGVLGSQDPRDIHFAQSANWQNYTLKVYATIGDNFNWDMSPPEQDGVTQKISSICTIL